MGNITSVHMQACKVGSSETHNLREKQLSYVVPEMSHLNESVIHEHIPEALARIETTYTEVTGQRMQPTATPLKEAVLVIRDDTTIEQVEKFGELCRQELGITPIQFHIHRDEGHYDSATKEWKPNLHAHIVFDCTCREHRLVERPAKFSKEMKSKNGKPPTKLIDNYGKIVRLSKADMSRMQDLASIATGMERGVPSDKVHLDAQRYKAQVIAEEVKALEQTYNEMQSANEELVKNNDLLKNSIEEQESTIEKQRAEISELRTQYDQVSEMVTNTYLDTKEQATVTLKEYDKVSGYADEPLKKDAEELRRDTLRDDSKVLAQRDVPAIYRMLSKLEGSLSKVIIGLSALLDRIKDEVHLQKAELGRIELQKSVKSAAKTVFDRVTDGLGISPKVRSLSKAVEDSQAQMKDQADSYREALTSKDRMIADLGSEKEKMKEEIRCLSANGIRLERENQDLRSNNASLRATVSDRNLRLQKVLSFIFKHFQPELVEKLAQIGLKDIIGKSNWERAQEDHERSQRQDIRRGLKM